MRLVKATLLDIPAMQKLVEREVEEGIILPRSDDEIATNIRSYVLAKEDDAVLGYTALHIHSPRLAEIRSLVVGEAYRHKGIGAKLVRFALDEARMLHVSEEVLALTYTPGFFAKLGFVEIAKEGIPEHKIWADCIKCKHFPICNEVAMVYKV
jgi:amino-acid N-acetyltransferase